VGDNVTHARSGCGGECCGVTHAFRVKWHDKPRLAHRVEFARNVLTRIERELPEKFERHDVYLLIHSELFSRPDIKALPVWEQIKHCPTCKWDIQICDYLHTNGYIALMNLHPGGRQSKFVVTELGREFIAGGRQAA
jgi:hypothetical protein